MHKIIILALSISSVLFFSSCSINVIRDNIIPLFFNIGTTAESGGAKVQFTEKSPYDAFTAVVVNTTADVYSEADRTSVRLTQLLFDEPIDILEQDDLWAKIMVDDDIEGWIRTRNFDMDWTCVDGRRYTERIVITDREKQIFSHARSGIVIRDVGMGTELYVVSKSDNVYQVALPGNLTGWISETGVFQLNAGEAIKKTTAEIFTQSCAKFRGVSYLRGGLSFLGIDGAGMLFVAAKINGVRLPRDFEGQFAKGEFVYGELDELKTGDVLFFSRDGQSMRINASGVYTGDGKFIHANQHTGKVQYEDIGDPYFKQRLLGVKRYFE